MRLSSKLAMVRKLLTNKKYRDAYVYEHVRTSVPFQIRTIREERQWTQGQLGEAASKPRNVISRLEDPNYGSLTLKTLFEVASAFDVGLLVKFVPFSRLLREYEDVSPSALLARSIGSEATILETWATAKDQSDSDLAAVTGTVVPEEQRPTMSTRATIRLAFDNKRAIQQALFPVETGLQPMRAYSLDATAQTATVIRYKS